MTSDVGKKFNTFGIPQTQLRDNILKEQIAPGGGTWGGKGGPEERKVFDNIPALTRHT